MHAAFPLVFLTKIFPYTMESMDVGKRPQLLLRQKFLAVACGVLAIISVALSYQLYSLRSSFSNWRELSELKSFSSPLSAAASIPPSTTLNTPTTLASPTPSTPAPPLDFFRNFIGRERCAFGSPDLHLPSANADLCPNRTALLDSMTDGGRRGFEAPYMPRDCDLRFYTTAEICAILSRFEDVVFLGDSMVRHLIGAFLMLLRENYEYGAQTQWTDRDKCVCTWVKRRVVRLTRSLTQSAPELRVRQPVLPLPLPRHRDT